MNTRTLALQQVFPKLNHPNNLDPHADMFIIWMVGIVLNGFADTCFIIISVHVWAHTEVNIAADY